MKDPYKFYLNILTPIIKAIFPCRVSGLEKLPEGPALVCANHSHMFDPFIIAINFGRKRRLYIMAKAELFKIPILKDALKAVGVFPVNRGETDIGAIRTAMKHLKAGDKVMLFPEGTRVSDEESVEAKTGAVRIAAKMKVDIVPVYLTKGRKAFRHTNMVVGDPFKFDSPPDKNFEPLAQELMDNIYQLEPKK